MCLFAFLLITCLSCWSSRQIRTAQQSETVPKHYPKPNYSIWKCSQENGTHLLHFWTKNNLYSFETFSLFKTFSLAELETTYNIIKTNQSLISALVLSILQHVSLSPCDLNSPSLCLSLTVMHRGSLVLVKSVNLIKCSLNLKWQHQGVCNGSPPLWTVAQTVVIALISAYGTSPKSHRCTQIPTEEACCSPASFFRVTCFSPHDKPRIYFFKVGNSWQFQHIPKVLLPGSPDQISANDHQEDQAKFIACS